MVPGPFTAQSHVTVFPWAASKDNLRPELPNSYGRPVLASKPIESDTVLDSIH